MKELLLDTIDSMIKNRDGFDPDLFKRRANIVRCIVNEAQHIHRGK